MQHPTSPLATRFARAGALLLAAVAAACGPERAGTPRLHGGAPSLDALGASVWSALVAGDTAALEELRLSEREHNELVWPEQPAAAQPAAAANLDLWWSNIQLRNATAARELLRRHGGSALRFQGVVCGGQLREFATFVALTECRLRLAGAEGGREIGAFRHVVRMDGVHKVVRYHAE